MSAHPLGVEVVRSPGHARVVLRGELDSHGVPLADAALGDASRQALDVTLDLRGLDFLDSSGLKLVLVWHRRLREAGVGFSILRGAPHVHRPFTSAGLEELLPFDPEPPT